MNQQYNPVQYLMQIVNSGQNPNVVLQRLQQQAMNNPQLQPVLKEFQNLTNQMRSSGMTPQQFVTQYAKQMGIDMTPFINSMTQKRY